VLAVAKNCSAFFLGAQQSQSFDYFVPKKKKKKTLTILRNVVTVYSTK
jgi:hypothetical protein